MNEKRYYSANEFFKNKFNSKIIKISLDAGFTCPNRDGTLSSKGCIFCSEKGSGEFAGNRLKSLREQFEESKKIMNKKWKSGKYMIYLQAFTNTYAPIKILERIYNEVISFENTAALSIATRPDCINESIVELIKEINKKVYVCVELGLQTSNEKTALFINRCYKNNIYEKAVEMLKSKNIDVITHIILGLPNETKEDMLNTTKYIINNNTNGVKFQLLHILKNTELEKIYQLSPFKILTIDEYIDILIECIELLPPDVIVHRITGDGPKSLLIEPLWSLNKKVVLNLINREFEKRNTFQSAKYNIF